MNTAEKIKSLINSSDYKNTLLGLLLIEQNPELFHSFQGCLLMHCYLHPADNIHTKAQQILALHYPHEQLEAWHQAFELFEIMDDLYDTESFDSYWYLFEQHEPLRLQYYSSIIEYSFCIHAYYQLAQCICAYYRCQLDCAASYYEMTLHHSPDNLNYLHTVAHFYYHDMLSAEKAAALLHKMLKIDSKHSEAVETLAFLQHDFYNNPAKGVDIILTHSTHPLSAEMQLNIAILNTYSKHIEVYEVALGQLAQYKQNDPLFYKALHAKAHALFSREQQYYAAETLYQQLLEYNPRDFYSLAALADLHGKQALNKPKKAMEYWQLAFSTFMDDPHYLVKYIYFLVNEADELEAAESYLDYLNAFCHNKITESHVWNFYKLNNYDKEQFAIACQLIDKNRWKDG